MSTSANENKNVAVCGGGLVGCLAAVYFAKRNFNVDLYEYRDDIRKMKMVVGRSINMAISVRGREGLRGIGCEELVTSKGIEMHSRMIHDLKGGMTAVPYGKKGQSILSIDRRFINELLLTEAEKYKNVNVHFNHKLKSCNTVEGEIVFNDTVSNHEVIKKTDLILGCDGAYSVVRQSLLKDKPVDYSQTYISSYYLELRMPPTKNGEFPLPVNYLHIWPRGDFMLIALPNQDKSFTCTLFMPNDMFKEIKTETDMMNFFEKYFPDTIDIFGKADLIQMYFSFKPSPLLSVKCNTHHGRKCVILGDAAHSMVPFYGQGMNCGFEDCTVFFDFVDRYSFDKLDTLLSEYSKNRVPDAHAICDLAMYNYIEMSYLVTTTKYKLRKKIDNFLFALFPKYWIPLYTMVTFSRIPYSEVVKRRDKQDKIIRDTIFNVVPVVGLGVAIFAFRDSIMKKLSS